MATETGSVQDLGQNEPRALALTVKEWKTGRVLVQSMLVFTLGSLASLYAAVGTTCKCDPVRLLLADGTALPRDPHVHVRALPLRHHDVLMCLCSRNRPFCTGQSTDATARANVHVPCTAPHSAGSVTGAPVRCARCDKTIGPPENGSHSRFHLRGYALDLCAECVPACHRSLHGRKLVPVPHDVVVRDGILSTLCPDLVWTPYASTPQDNDNDGRAWLTSRYGPYVQNPQLLDVDVRSGAGVLRHADALVWLWPPPR